LVLRDHALAWLSYSTTSALTPLSVISSESIASMPPRLLCQLPSISIAGLSLVHSTPGLAVPCTPPQPSVLGSVSSAILVESSASCAVARPKSTQQ
jgi:hypothetical protein